MEDCEYSKLLVRILYLLGKVGPRSPFPSKYIRHIYNRVVLDVPVVRIAAVSALYQFAVELSAWQARITVLLRLCLSDNDDEVRDRAALYLSVLENAAEKKKDAAVPGIIC